jgi:hypothetical protein
MKNILSKLLILLSITLSSCGLINFGPEPVIDISNNEPAQGEIVILDGTKSSGSALSYAWELISLPESAAAELSSETAATIAIRHPN